MQAALVYFPIEIRCGSTAPRSRLRFTFYPVYVSFSFIYYYYRHHHQFFLQTEQRMHTRKYTKIGTKSDTPSPCAGRVAETQFLLFRIFVIMG